MKTPAVLLIAFNRPDLAMRVLDVVREAGPSRLYFATDGPRKGSKEDELAVRQCQNLVGRVDWDCQLRTRFLDQNEGCGGAVRGAIDWFFENEDEGIILEDDTLPGEDFFKFCSIMLSRYRKDSQVMSIGGFSEINERLFGNDSYRFTKYNLIWGWATWKRAWERHSLNTKTMNEILDIGWLEEFLEPKEVEDYWSDQFRKVVDGEIDTWDYQWRLSIWRNDGLSILPRKNLVQNIGFDERATHTQKMGRKNWDLSAESLDQPYKHPSVVRENLALTRALEEQRFGINIKSKRFEKLNFFQFGQRLCQRLSNRIFHSSRS